MAKFKDEEVTLHAAIQITKGLYRKRFRKQHQKKKLGIFSGDSFQIKIFENTTKYEVEILEELEAVLKSDPEPKTGVSSN